VARRDQPGRCRRKKRSHEEKLIWAPQLEIREAILTENPMRQTLLFSGAKVIQHSETSPKKQKKDKKDKKKKRLWCELAFRPGMRQRVT